MLLRQRLELNLKQFGADVHVHRSGYLAHTTRGTRESALAGENARPPTSSFLDLRSSPSAAAVSSCFAFPDSPCERANARAGARAVQYPHLLGRRQLDGRPNKALLRAVEAALGPSEIVELGARKIRGADDTLILQGGGNGVAPLFPVHCGALDATNEGAQGRFRNRGCVAHLQCKKPNDAVHQR